MKVIILGGGMFYGLYRNINGRHFVGYIHHIIGPMTNEITQEELNSMPKYSLNHFFDQVQPFDEDEIDSFYSASLETLIAMLD